MNELSSYTVDGITPKHVLRPGSVAELSAAVAEADNSRQAVIPFGGGTGMTLGNLPRRYDLAVDVTDIESLFEHNPGDLTAKVNSGMTINCLQKRLCESGQRLAFDPPSPEQATIGGAIAANAVGPLRSAFGGIRDLIIGMTIILANGSLVKSGGQVVKNVQGFDLHRLQVGALGTLGILVDVSFKLAPIPAKERTVVALFEDLDSVFDASQQIIGRSFEPEGLAVLAGESVPPLISFMDQPDRDAKAPYMLLVRLAGGLASIQRQTDLVTGAAGATSAKATSVLENDGDASRFWKAIDDVANAPALLRLRSTVMPASGFQLLADLERLKDLTPDNHFAAVLHSSFGTVIASWTNKNGVMNSSNERVSKVVEKTRSVVRRLGACIVLEAAQPDLKRSLDVFGDLGPSVEIMRRLKIEFDPYSTLNPGRFVGGI